VATDRPPFPQKPRGPELSFRDIGHRDLVEMNHRIANSLQLTAGYLMLQAKELAIESSARSALGAAAARVSVMAALHRQIGANFEPSGIDLATYLMELCSKIRGSTGVEVSFAGDPVDVSFPTAQRIAQIITELAINAAKHASTERGEGLLRVDCRCDHGNMLHLTLSDDGPGLQEDCIPSASGGVGLAIVASVVEELEGRLDVTRDSGTVFELTVPIH
jgi:two-component sensor histidine kinase